MVDINYYKTVAETQNDPEILKAELLDLIKEVEESIPIVPPVGVPKPNTTCENLVAKLDEYIKLLTDEIGEFAPYLFIHGIGSTRVEEGIKLREEIKELRNKFEQREA